VKLYVDLETLQLIEGPGFRNPTSSLRFKRGDAAQIEVTFLAGGTTPVAIGDPLNLEIQFGIKPRNRYDIGYLVRSASWIMPTTEPPIYRCSPSFNTIELNSALGVGSATGSELAEITLMGEITWREGSAEPTSTRTFLVVVENDVNRGTEGVPTSAEPPYPAPLSIMTTGNLAGSAVLHNATQTLSSSQKAQARANIGAQTEITNGSLSIARTAGLQSALNSKAEANHQHVIPGTGEAVEAAVMTKVGIAAGLSTNDLSPALQAQHLLVVNDGMVWLHSPLWPTDPIVLKAGEVTPPPAGPSSTTYIAAAQYGTIQETVLLTGVSPGTYLITLSLANYSTSMWSSHNLVITDPNFANGTIFFDPYIGDFAFMALAPEVVFALNEPAFAPNPQIGTVMCTVTNSCDLVVYGSLPVTGDYVELTITLTPI